ncbi:MAG TPA: hypothetical protein VFE04_03505, partial [Puia sp.]|nr:hypothetical protein [Puia sp.]
IPDQVLNTCFDEQNPAGYWQCISINRAGKANAQPKYHSPSCRNNSPYTGFLVEKAVISG